MLNGLVETGVKSRNGKVVMVEPVPVLGTWQACDRVGPISGGRIVAYRNSEYEECRSCDGDKFKYLVEIPDNYPRGEAGWLGSRGDFLNMGLVQYAPEILDHQKRYWWACEGVVEVMICLTE